MKGAVGFIGLIQKTQLHSGSIDTVRSRIGQNWPESKGSLKMNTLLIMIRTTLGVLESWAGSCNTEKIFKRRIEKMVLHSQNSRWIRYNPGWSRNFSRSDFVVGKWAFLSLTEMVECLHQGFAWQYEADQMKVYCSKGVWSSFPAAFTWSLLKSAKKFLFIGLWMKVVQFLSHLQQSPVIVG